MKKNSYDLKKCLSRVFIPMNLAVMLFASLAWADGLPVPAGAPVAQSAPQQPGGLMAFAPFLLMFAVLYFLILRPQQKRMKEQQSMINALKQGDEIMTQSGILGKVTGITEKVVTVEIADNVRVKMLKSQVSQVLKGSIKDLA